MKNPQLRDFLPGNATAGDRALLREYEALAEQIGLPPEKFDSALRWYKANGEKYAGNPERLKSSFTTFMQQDGVDAQHVEKLVEWHGIVSQHGVLETFAAEEQGSDEARESGAAHATPEREGRDGDKPDAAVTARLAEIRAARRADPHAYDSNKELQSEELALLEGKPWPPTHQWPTEIRRAEIRAARRADPDAFRDDRGAVEAEEIALLQMDIPGRESSPPPAAPAPQGGNDAID